MQEENNNTRPPAVRELSTTAPFRWLKSGWSDLRHSGPASILHGVFVALFSLLILLITPYYWYLLPGAISGFVLIGPILATGLYALSSRIEKGKSAQFKDAINAWKHSSRCVFKLGLILVMAATAWVVFSVIMFKFFIATSIDTPLDFLRYVVTQNDLNFLLWTILGGMGSALAFSITVVALPMLMERDVTMEFAILTSIKAVGNNPVTMFWWAMIIMMLTGVSFLTGMFGFILLYPILGHASWHAYREVVVVDDLPMRPMAE